jgi:hypothetical protein
LGTSGTSGSNVNIYNSDGTLTGTRTITAAGFDLAYSNNQNQASGFYVNNTTAGTLSQSGFQATSDTTAGSARFGKVSSSFTQSTIVTASDLAIINSTAGDIAIVNSFATGKIKFGIGTGTSALMTLTSAGELLLGTTTDAGAYILQATGQIRFNSYTSNAAYPSTAPVGYLGFDASGNILSVAAPYTLQAWSFAIANFTFTDAQLLYIGAGNSLNVASTEGQARIYVPNTGTITAIYVYANGTTTGSTETWTLDLLKNNSTAVTIQSLSGAANAFPRLWSNTALSISVAAGDYLEIRSNSVTWATNPVCNAGTGFNATIFIE